MVIKEECKKTKGITLIALMIIIIALLILAGVTINLTLGNNGIFKTTEQAAKNHTKAGVIENVTGGNSGTIPEDILKVGDYVKYDTGTAGVKTFRVLYDGTSEYGLQIISDKNLEDVTLEGSDWATGRDSYNNAITTLNTAAMKYLNTKYATDARCVGSNPSNKNAENVGPVQIQFTTTIEGANNMREEDTNYITDETAMRAAGIWTTGECYWLASRDVGSLSSFCIFDVRGVDTGGEHGSELLCSVGTDGSFGRSKTAGLRSCISLKSGIKVTAGDGKSEATAFELSI